MQHLIYVSNNVILPDGQYNPFFLQEQPLLSEQFGSFSVVCPDGYYECEVTGKLVKQISVGILCKFTSIVTGLCDKELFREICHMANCKVLSIKKVVQLVCFSIRAAVLTELLEKIYQTRGRGRETIVYSFWLAYDAYAVAKFKKQHNEIRAIARAHAYEINPNRNVCVPYLMKRAICETLDKIAFISSDALNIFLRYFENPDTNICVQYLGSTCKNTNIPDRHEDDVMTIVSCSSIIPLKQLDWMVLALKKGDLGKVHWIHIGDGPEKQRILDMIAREIKTSENIQIEFTGNLQNSKVRERLAQSDVDLFVNMSQTEGVPVSIMEAMSFGIPIIAPEINGIPEIVDHTCGILFNVEGGPRQLYTALQKFRNMNDMQKKVMGKAAHQKWASLFCLERNLKGFLENE